MTRELKGDSGMFLKEVGESFWYDDTCTAYIYIHAHMHIPMLAVLSGSESFKGLISKFSPITHST